jgi:hypothetical protein
MYDLAGEYGLDLEALGARLRRMYDRHLLRFEKSPRYMCSPEANLRKEPRRVFVIQLREAVKEWRVATKIARDKVHLSHCEGTRSTGGQRQKSGRRPDTARAARSQSKGRTNLGPATQEKGTPSGQKVTRFQRSSAAMRWRLNGLIKFLGEDATGGSAPTL